MIILDANILVSAILGVQVKVVLERALTNGVSLAVPEPQLAEAARVLTDKLGLTLSEAEEVLDATVESVALLGQEFYGAKEADARRRLHERGQSDWPVLAAALASEGGVWSHDRDFFGVGVPVWSSRNMRCVEGA